MEIIFVSYCVAPPVGLCRKQARHLRGAAAGWMVWMKDEQKLWRYAISCTCHCLVHYVVRCTVAYCIVTHCDSFLVRWHMIKIYILYQFGHV